MPLPQVQSFGCRLNIWESQVVGRHSTAAGLADTLIINTCAVTAEAERQARQAVRRGRRENPDAQIVVTGCSAQINAEQWQSMPEVDAVVGNHEKLQVETWQRLGQNLGSRNSTEPLMAVGDIMSVKETCPHLLEGFDSHSRAFLQIQQGCDHRCTFCVIPYGRGNNRSVPAASIIHQIETLVAGGIAEVVLTGVDIASWGSDLGGSDLGGDPRPGGKPCLGKLVRHILDAVPQLPRLRLSSLDPVAVDADLITAFAEDSRLMPHVHLSLQHGADLILKRMKRRHNADTVLRLVAELRAVRPDIIFGADVIAGFPTEDAAAHQASLDSIAAAQITWLHVFPFSPRPNTPAARMPQVDRGMIKARTAELRQYAQESARRFLDSKIGQNDEIVLETGGVGHSRQFAKFRLIDGDEGTRAGTLYQVRITGRKGDVLLGGRI